MKRIIVGCEESQAVTIAFRKLGFEAYSCDIKDCSGGHPEWHIKDDIFNVLRSNFWDAGIFFPDCTYLTISAEWAYKDPDYKRYPKVGYHQKVKASTLTGADRREAREEALSFVKRLWNSDIENVAIENPVGVLGTRWKKQTQVIQPYEFGDNASKKTCLWLKNLPLLKPTNYIEGRFVCCGLDIEEVLGKYGCPNCEGENTAKRRWGNQTNSGQNKLPPTVNRAELRSKTYPGIAKAMAEQWGFHINNQDIL